MSGKIILTLRSPQLWKIPSCSQRKQWKSYCLSHIKSIWTNLQTVGNNPALVWLWGEWPLRSFPLMASTNPENIWVNSTRNCGHSTKISLKAPAPITEQGGYSLLLPLLACTRHPGRPSACFACWSRYTMLLSGQGTSFTQSYTHKLAIKSQVGFHPC